MNQEEPTTQSRTPETTSRSEAIDDNGLESEALPLWRAAQEHLLAKIQCLDPGASLPSYAELADELGCSIAPIKQAARELAAQGWISLQRGRPAKVLWTGSFRASVKRADQQLETRAFHTAYRPLEPAEASIGDDLRVAHGQSCIVCGRVRIIDGKPAAISMAYINPVFFSNPDAFFLDHDIVLGSLREVYASLGVRPLRIPAILKPALADEWERGLLNAPPYTPVLRAHQQTLVEWRGVTHMLEVLKGTYTNLIDYRVDRLTEWRSSELSI